MSRTAEINVPKVSAGRTLANLGNRLSAARWDRDIMAAVIPVLKAHDGRLCNVRVLRAVRAAIDQSYGVGDWHPGHGSKYFRVFGSYNASAHPWTVSRPEITFYVDMTDGRIDWSKNGHLDKQYASSLEYVARLESAMAQDVEAVVSEYNKAADAFMKFVGSLGPIVEAFVQ